MMSTMTVEADFRADPGNQSTSPASSTRAEASASMPDLENQPETSSQAARGSSAPRPEIFEIFDFDDFSTPQIPEPRAAPPAPLGGGAAPISPTSVPTSATTSDTDNVPNQPNHGGIPKGPYRQPLLEVPVGGDNEVAQSCAVAHSKEQPLVPRKRPLSSALASDTNQETPKTKGTLQLKFP